jgi:putative hydrolase of HD superfamily
MTPAQVREKILNDDQFILEETRKIQTLYGLKSVIRYHQKRAEEIQTESVAEHVYAMQMLATYFLPLEDIDHAWEHERIRLMIQFHDIDEIETGDTIGYLKTKEQVQNEHAAQTRIIAKLPFALLEVVQIALDEYDKQETNESRFAKAIDKIEPAFHLLNENGKKICRMHNQTYEQHRSIKEAYVKFFPCIKRFNEVTAQAMIKQGFFG